MQKVYLLLRNNQQNGPYSLEELLQFNLKPVDLIWIEGKSAGWYYPQEIQALQPHLSFLKQSAPQPAVTVQPNSGPSELSKPKKVFVSMPVNSASIKAEAGQINPYQPSFAKQSSTPAEPIMESKGTEGLKTTYAKRLDEIETEYTNWAYQTRKKKKSVVSGRRVLAACLLIGAGLGGWWAVQSFSASEKRQPANGQSMSAIPAELPQEVPAITETNEASTPVKAKIKTASKETPAARIKTIKAEQKINNQEVVVTRKPVADNEYEDVIPGPVANKEVVEEKRSEPVITETPTEKKKLKEKILDIFKKKKEEPVTESTTKTEEVNGERRASRREGSANLATQLTVKFERPNEWMMGIKGAKALVTNRSNETISKAVIEVSYYNEDNEVLQTRTISILNIGAKKTTIVSIPDHSFADHLDYKTISVVGAAEPFAKM